MAGKGGPPVQALAEGLRDGQTSEKEWQERVSGWLERYDSAGPIDSRLWKTVLDSVGRDTVIALDGSDLSKDSGGKGREGMEMGRDASRAVLTMGRNLLAAAVNGPRAKALRLKLLNGRR